MSERIVAWFAGSRDWTDPEPVQAVIDGLPAHTVVVHGAQRGLDQLAGVLAARRGLHVAGIAWRPDIHGRRAAGPMRNKAIAALSPTVGYAYPLGDSPGTNGMIALCDAANVPLFVWDAPAGAWSRRP